MPQVTIDLDASAVAALPTSPEGLGREVKTAAVVEWYAEGRLSQSAACQILAVGRVEFLDELARRRVPACQLTPEELREELGGV